MDGARGCDFKLLYSNEMTEAFLQQENWLLSSHKLRYLGQSRYFCLSLWYRVILLHQIHCAQVFAHPDPDVQRC